MPLLMEQPIHAEDWARETQNRNGHALSSPKTLGKAGDAGPWEPAVQKIVSFQLLEDDWDGFGAQAASRELLESAIGLAYLFLDKGVEPPQCVVPGLEGSIDFEWFFPDGAFAHVELIRPFFAEVMLMEPGKPPKHWTIPAE